MTRNQARKVEKEEWKQKDYLSFTRPPPIRNARVLKESKRRDRKQQQAKKFSQLGLTEKAWFC
jgi:hypothetical protein